MDIEEHMNAFIIAPVLADTYAEGNDILFRVTSRVYNHIDVFNVFLHSTVQRIKEMFPNDPPSRSDPVGIVLPNAQLISFRGTL